MNGVLLDTHALIWLRQPAPMSLEALLAIDRAAKANAVKVSPISAWELGAAVRKKNPNSRPDLGDLSAEEWFLRAISELGTSPCPIDEAIGIAALNLPAIYGYADPGDCFLIASAHICGLTLITRDHRILAFARSNPNYLSVIRC